jgi:hypothetical protein
MLQKAATRRKPVERSIRRLPRQGRHPAESSYEKEARRKKHREDCHDRTGMLQKAAARRKPVERSIRRLPRQGRHAAESSCEKEARRKKH